MVSRLSLGTVLTVALMLGAWSPGSNATLRCCYTGDVLDTQAAVIKVKLEGGRAVPFGELFPDFTSSTTFFPLFYPVYRLDIARVVYAHLAVKFIDYDANDNGFIEEPELNVLFMEEIARGLDHPVEQLGEASRIRAIFVPPGDIDGLIRMANRRRSEMTPEAQKTFDEIDLLRIDFRLDGTEPGEQGDNWSALSVGHGVRQRAGVR